MITRLDEEAKRIEPIFSGPNSKEYERICIKIEERFLVYLQTLRLKAHKILDVQEPTWYDDMFAFQNEMKDLEITIGNLVNVVFKDMNNVQEGITNLYGFKIYMNRKSLKSLFDSITTKVRITIVLLNLPIQKFINDRHNYYELNFAEDMAAVRQRYSSNETRNIGGT